MFYRHVLLVACAAAGVQGLRLSTAEACVCQRGRHALWPNDSATGVPTDTPLLFESDGSGPLFPAGTLLPLPANAGSQIGADGVSLGGGESPGLYAPSHQEWVRLAAHRTLPSGGLCSGDVIITFPEKALRANTDYEVHAPPSDREAGGVLSAFRTGAGPEFRRAVAVPEILAVGDAEDPSSILELFVTKPAVPLLFHTEGLTDPVTTLLGPFREVERPAPLGGVECPEVELLTLRGESILKRQLCEADFCYPAPLQLRGSCGGNPISYLGSTRSMLDASLTRCATPGSGLPVGDRGDGGHSLGAWSESGTGSDAGRGAVEAPVGGPSAKRSGGVAADAGSESGHSEQHSPVALNSVSSSGCSLGSPSHREGETSQATLVGLLALAFVRRRRNEA